MLDIYLKYQKPMVPEGSSFTLTAYFRNAATAQAPTTARYRIDCLSSSQVIRDWTSLTAATSIDIAITPADNVIKNQLRTTERRQITVESDTDLDTQVRRTADWKIENILGI